MPEKKTILKVENNNSKWEFWDLFVKTVDGLHKEAKEIDKYTDQKIGFERALIKFLERLPSGDYSNLREEWNERD